MILGSRYLSRICVLIRRAPIVFLLTIWSVRARRPAIPANGYVMRIIVLLSSRSAVFLIPSAILMRISGPKLIP